MARLLFKSDGTRMFVRSFINLTRRSKAAVAEYARGLLQRGFVEGARAGKFMAVPTSLCREEWTLELVAGATLAEAMYLALEWEPDNPMLQDLAISGLVLLQPKTPIDALCYYRDEANMMVGYGAQRSFVEDFGVIDELEAYWKTMRKNTRWSQIR